MDSNSSGIIVLDIGTNTFHIVVFERKNDIVTELYRCRKYVFLAEQGIDTICDEALFRAKEAIRFFSTIIKNQFSNYPIQIVGTAGLRKASNGPDLKTFIENTFKTEVNIISGQREAELIFKGIIWEKNNLNQDLIVDIGGGSTEMIYVIDNKIAWKQSFPIGVGVLYHKFQPTEPTDIADLKPIHAYLNQVFDEWLLFVKQHTIRNIVGASGSYDVLLNVHNQNFEAGLSGISPNQFNKVKEWIYSKNQEERNCIDGLPPVRAKLAGVSFILMDWILQQSNAKNILVSKYAVKEGVVFEKMIENG